MTENDAIFLDELTGNRPLVPNLSIAIAFSDIEILNVK